MLVLLTNLAVVRLKFPMVASSRLEVLHRMYFNDLSGIPSSVPEVFLRAEKCE